MNLYINVACFKNTQNMMCISAVACFKNTQKLVCIDAVIAGKLDETLLKGYLSGLRYLHGIHYVHGDVEPRHLCISALGSPAIIDLGEARKEGANSPRAAWTYRGTLCMLLNVTHPSA